MIRSVRFAPAFLLLTAALAHADAPPAATPAPAAPAAQGGSATEHPAGPEGLQPGTAAPSFTLPVVNDFPDAKKWGPGKWTGPDAKDAQKKLVIMSFFATYCEPCKKEMPELSRIYDAYKDQGLGVMLVSIDKGDDQKQVIIDLAKQNNVKFPVMHDRFQVVARRYSAERLPYMLLLDNNGTVKGVHVGYTDEVKAGLENEVRAGLGLPPLEPPKPEKADKKGKKAAKGGT
jgi:thiol-disulfide isomerase/thioredoxin